MKSRCLAGTAAVICGLALALWAGAAWSATVLKVQSAYIEKSYGPELLKLLAEKAKAYSDGEVELKLFWPGQLVSVEDGFDALGKGMIDGLYSTGLYYAGTLTESKVEWLPYNWRTPQDVVEIYTKHGFLQKMREFSAKHDAYYLYPICVASMGAMTKFPVAKLDDFKGKKLRATGMDASLAQALGAAPTAIVGAEQYTALKMGTLDGTIFPYYTIHTYKLNEVVDHIILPGFHTPAITVLWFNQKAWQKLSPKAREALERAGLEIFKLSAEKSAAWDQEGVDFSRANNVKVMTLPDEEVKKIRALCRPLYDKVADGSPGAKALLDILDQFYRGK
jgi:TRAP-type C4-dicarboxylate transport system substrate-binding protein